MRLQSLTDASPCVLERLTTRKNAKISPSAPSPCSCTLSAPPQSPTSARTRAPPPMYPPRLALVLSCALLRAPRARPTTPALRAPTNSTPHPFPRFPLLPSEQRQHPRALPFPPPVRSRPVSVLPASPPPPAPPVSFAPALPPRALSTSHELERAPSEARARTVTRDTGRRGGLSPLEERRESPSACPSISAI